MAGVHGFGGTGSSRFAGHGGGMGAGGGAQGEPLRVTIALPNAMKQNVRARCCLVFHSRRTYNEVFSCDVQHAWMHGCETKESGMKWAGIDREATDNPCPIRIPILRPSRLRRSSQSKRSPACVCVFAQNKNEVTFVLEPTSAVYFPGAARGDVEFDAFCFIFGI